MNSCMRNFRSQIKDKHKIQVLFLLVLFFGCILASIFVWKSHYVFPVREGCIDLNDIDLSEGKSVQLKGEWEFFEKKLIVTELLKDVEPDRLVRVPGGRAGSLFSSDWGSYRICLLNCPPETDISVSLGGMPAAYRIFINGQSVGKSGLVSRSSSMKISSGFSEDISLPMRSSTCELVIEVSGGLLPGLTVAPVLMEKEHYAQKYQKYQAAVFMFSGMMLLYVLSYGLGLLLTSRGRYSVVSFLVGLLLLMHSLVVDVVCTAVFGSINRPYDWILLLAYAGRLLAWIFLLCREDQWEQGTVLSRKRGRIAGYAGGVLLLFVIMAGFLCGNTLWWLMADVWIAIFLMIRLCCFAARVKTASPETVVLETGMILLWLGGTLEDFAMAGIAPYTYKTGFFCGAVLFNLSIYVVDRHRMRLAQQKALEAVRTEKELERARMELALHQIKPHFLHNALMSIKVLCRRNPSEAEEAIYDFATFLRSNMKAIEASEQIPFTDELKTIEGYLHIEQIRFGERLHVVWDIQEKEFQIPPLTIQPLVENAVCHGICPKVEGGSVEISTYREAGYIVICVADDGVGFDASAPESDGIGIKNLRLRLETLLGASLEIESRPGEGCRQYVRICEGALPQEVRNEDYFCR